MLHVIQLAALIILGHRMQTFGLFTSKNNTMESLYYYKRLTKVSRQ